MYQVELVWNREFRFVSYGRPHNTINEAIAFAKELENMGNGESVKKTRILKDDKVVFEYGKMVNS